MEGAKQRTKKKIFFDLKRVGEGEGVTWYENSELNFFKIFHRSTLNICPQSPQKYPTIIRLVWGVLGLGIFFFFFST